MKVSNPVVIHWVDSASAGGWHPKDETLTPDEIVSVGMMWSSTDEYVTIVQSEGSSEVAGLFSIPRACIKSIANLYFDSDDSVDLW